MQRNARQQKKGRDAKGVDGRLRQAAELRGETHGTSFVNLLFAYVPDHVQNFMRT
jgi:hypothetical protein